MTIKHTLQKILGKNKSIKIFEYFLKFPFAKLIVSNESKSLITHAGVLPSWSLNSVLSANEELTEALKSDPEKFLSNMYSDRRKDISKSTNKRNRARFLVNVFTRMRFITKDNKLDLQTKVKLHPEKNINHGSFMSTAVWMMLIILSLDIGLL